MRIGFDAKRVYNNFTGLGNYSRTLVGNIIRDFSEDEIFLYTPKRKIDLVGGAITRMPINGKATWRSCGVKKDLKKDAVDIYHGLSHDLPFGIHKTGIKSVVTIHDVCYKTFPEMFPLVERLIYDVKYRYSCRHADRIVAISESTKADIMKYLGVSPDKIEVIYQSINPVFYTPQIDPRKTVDAFGIAKRYVLYVGSINSRKNLLGIIKAYEFLPEELRLPLVVIGNGSTYKDQVMKYVMEKNMNEYLVMLDSVKDMVTLQAFYQCAECFVYPSFYEGFGLPVTEALLSGVPVITSSVSSLPEAGGDAALYVDPSEPKQIADAIRKVLTDKLLVAQMVQQGLDYARKTFDPTKLTARVHDLYERVLGG